MMSSAGRDIQIPEAVPLFPLPNLVLFPGAILPLHIFEDRYRKMTADVLQSHRQIAMALLKTGWEKDYYGRPAIEPIVCLGAILSHERLADGRYNFLLQGKARARVVREVGDEPYRQAALEVLTQTHDDENELKPLRAALVKLFEQPSYASLAEGGQIHELLRSEVPTAILADLLAFRLLPDDQVQLKQSLLAETDVKQRVGRVLEAVTALRPAWQNVPADARLN